MAHGGQEYVFDLRQALRLQARQFQFGRALGHAPLQALVQGLDGVGVALALDRQPSQARPVFYALELRRSRRARAGVIDGESAQNPGAATAHRGGPAGP